MKITITGATGHIGANMTLALVEKGYQVKAFCRAPENIKSLGDLNLEVARGDILELDTLNDAFKGSEVVIHLAGKITIEGDPDGSVWQTNVVGTRNVVAACLQNKVKKLIHFSSIHASKYDQSTPLVNESTPYADKDSFHYDRSKAAGEQEVLKGMIQGLDATIFCPTGVIGPHDYFNSRSGELIQNLFTGKMPALIQGGFDWVDVRDLVDATLHILENGAASPRYILSGHWVSFKELDATCQSISGKQSWIPVLPVWVAMLGLPFIRVTQLFSKRPPLYTYESLMIIKNDCQNYSSKLAEAELNYSKRSTEESIRAIYEWRKADSIFPEQLL